MHSNSCQKRIPTFKQLENEHMMREPEDNFDHITEGDRSSPVSLRSCKDEHQNRHFRFRYHRIVLQRTNLSHQCYILRVSSRTSKVCLMILKEICLTILKFDERQSTTADLSNAELFTNAEPMTNTSAINNQNFFKRTADITRLDEGDEDEHRLKKTRHEDQCAGLRPHERF